MVRIEVAGDTMTDALRTFCANLDDADMEKIITELGHRLAADEYEPRIIHIVPWAETESGKRMLALNAKKKAKRASKTKRAKNKAKRARR